MTDEALFTSSNDLDIPDLSLDMCADYLVLPYIQWGSVARYRAMTGTWGFYIDDVVMEPVWSDPEKLLKSTPYAIIEPNFSMTVDTPASLAIWQVYRKRWLSRFWQTKGIRTIVDMSVHAKWGDLNLLGVPRGWWAFCTRGYTREPDRLFLDQYDHAREIAAGSGKFLFVVYGGGAEFKSRFPGLKDVLWSCDLEEELDGYRWSSWQIGKGLHESGQTLKVEPARETWRNGEFEF